MSLSERVLWYHIRNDQFGFRFKRQARVKPFYLDFYCAKAPLCIEVDGEQHSERRERDAYRDQFLIGRGIETMRIPSSDLFDENGMEVVKWVEKIRRRCDERIAAGLSPQPPLQDEPLGAGEPE